MSHFFIAHDDDNGRASTHMGGVKILQLSIIMLTFYIQVIYLIGFLLDLIGDKIRARKSH
ncbi:hypothetical protein BZG19_06975 [Salinivibrio kushneri]|nr:hypothetical protein BZG19_06975 [Salinivibrio kushneri]